MSRKYKKKGNKINPKTLLVTVDIGKKRNQGYFYCQARPEEKTFSFPNTGKGYGYLWGKMLGFKHKNGLEDIVLGIESTSNYGHPLLHYMNNRGVLLVQVNPKHGKRVKELVDNTPNKTDKKDPRVIATLVLLGTGLTVVVPQGVCAHLRHLSHARERVYTRLHSLYSQLHELVFIIFPELLTVMRSVERKSTQYLLRNYPLPEDIVRCGLADLTTMLRKQSRGQLGRERAEELYEAAQYSGGIKEGSASILYEIGIILGYIHSVQEDIRELENKLSDYLHQMPYSKFLLSVKGIGEVTAAILLGEYADLKAFRSASEAEKFAGLNLYEVSSGRHKGTKRISKVGRSLLRKGLYFAALNTVRSGGVMHTTYQGYLSRHMKKNKALIAVARKLVRLVFALVRDEREYHPEYERFYRNREAA